MGWHMIFRGGTEGDHRSVIADSIEYYGDLE